MSNQRQEQCPNHKRRKFRQFHLDAWAVAGLSQAEYCRQNNLRPNRFTYWKQKLSRENLPVEFVQVPEASLQSVVGNLLQKSESSCLRLTPASRFTRMDFLPPP